MRIELVLPLLATTLLPTHAPGAERVFVTNQASNTVSVVDPADNTVESSLPLGVGYAPCAAVLTPDESKLLVANQGSDSVSVIDTATRHVLANIPVGARPCSIAVTPDGKRAYVAGTPVAVIDIEALQLVAVVPLEIASGGIVVSPDGSLAYASNEFSGFVYVIDPKANRTVRQIEVPSSGKGIAISEDGDFVYVTNITSDATGPPYGLLSIIDTSSEHVIGSARVGPYLWRVRARRNAYVTELPADTLWVVDPSSPNSSIALNGCPSAHDVAVDGTERFAYVTGAGDHLAGLLCEFDLLKQSLVRTVRIGRAANSGITITADGSTLYVTNRYGTVHVVDTATLTVTATISGGDNPVAIVASPDERTAYVALYNSGRIAVIDTPSSSISGTIEIGGTPAALAISPDGAELFVMQPGLREDNIAVADTRSRAIVRYLDVPTDRGGITVHPDGRRLYVANFDNPLIREIDVQDGHLLRTFDVRTSPQSLHIDPTGSLLYLPGFGLNEVSVIDLASERIVATVDVSDGIEGALQPCWLDFTGDRRRGFVTYYNAGRVTAFDVATNLPLGSTSIGAPYAAETCSLAVSTDDRHVYVANFGNNLLTVLNADTLAIETHIPTGLGPNGVVVVCPDCPTATPTPSATATASATPTPTLGPCHGDCGRDGRVTVDELVRAVNIALETVALSACALSDADGNGAVEIDDLVRAVGAALAGCRA